MLPQLLSRAVNVCFGHRVSPEAEGLRDRVLAEQIRGHLAGISALWPMTAWVPARTEATEILGSWAGVVLDLVPDALPEDEHLDTADVRAVCAFLTEHAALLAEVDDGSAAAEFRAVRDRLESVADPVLRAAQVDLTHIAATLQALSDARAGWRRHGVPAIPAQRTASEDWGAGTRSASTPAMPNPIPSPRAEAVLWSAAIDLAVLWLTVTGEAASTQPTEAHRVAQRLAIALADSGPQLRAHVADEAKAMRAALERQARNLVDVRDIVTVGRCRCGLVLSTDSEATTVTCELLSREEDSGLIREGCGTVWNVAELRRQSLRSAEDSLATAPELAGAIPDLSTNQIRTWCAKGKLAQHGTRPEGSRSVALYRVGDVVDLSDEAKAKRDARRVVKA